MGFPLTALELTQMASERLEKQAETVHERMIQKLLPETIHVIFDQAPDCREALRGIRPETRQQLEIYIAQALWSNPGSMGGFRVEQLLTNNGINKDDADTLATAIMRYSRYSMGLVNLIRHYQSAISAIYDAIEPIQFRDRYLSAPNLPVDFIENGPRESARMAKQVFQNSDDVSNWLTDMEFFIARLTAANSWARKKVLQENSSHWKKGSVLNSGMAKAYTRRFGRFLMQEFSFIDLGGRYQPSKADRDQPILKELQKLEKTLSGESKYIFEQFEQDYESRKHRIISLKRPFTSPSKQISNSDSSFVENYINNYLKLDDRELIIRSNTDKVSNQLIDQMYRLFKMQLEINPSLLKFEGKTAREGQLLILELERPTPKDASKIRKILTTLLESSDSNLNKKSKDKQKSDFSGSHWWSGE